MSRFAISLSATPIPPSDYRANRVAAVKRRLEENLSTPPGLAALAQSMG